MGQLPGANICEEYLHWALLLEEEGSLGLLPLQRLHALQVAGHQGAAVLWEGFCQRGNLPKIIVKDICQGNYFQEIILNSPLPQPGKLPWPWQGLRSRLRWG